MDKVRNFLSEVKGVYLLTEHLTASCMSVALLAKVASWADGRIIKKQRPAKIKSL